MKVSDMLAAFLANFDVANERASGNKQARPWKVLEIRNDQFVVRDNVSGKKFRIHVKEET